MLTQAGYKPIASLVIGDIVLSRDEVTGETAWNAIVNTFKNWHENDIVVLTIQDTQGNIERITTTQEHPFMLKQYTWTNAGELVVGDELAGITDNESLYVRGVKTPNTPLYVTTLPLRIITHTLWAITMLGFIMQTVMLQTRQTGSKNMC